MARALGQLLPGDAELDDSASRRPRTTGRTRTASCHATRSSRYLERYAAGFEAPVREGVAVTAVQKLRQGGFALETSAGDLRADAVVLATGAYQRAHRPAGASTLPPDLLQIDVQDYRNEQALPPGRRARSRKRPVRLPDRGGAARGRPRGSSRLREGALGAAPPRRSRHHLVGSRVRVRGCRRGVPSEPGCATRRELPGDRARRRPRPPPADAPRGGRHAHRPLPRRRATAGCASPTTSPRPSPGATSDTPSSWASFARPAAERGVDPPDIEAPEPFDPRGPEEIDPAGLGAVVFAGGFRPDYRSWLPWPEAFDELGFPIQQDGASTVIPGLHFVGVHFLRKRKSSLLLGVGEDAGIVAERVAESLERG